MPQISTILLAVNFPVSHAGEPGGPSQLGTGDLGTAVELDGGNPVAKGVALLGGAE